MPAPPLESSDQPRIWVLPTAQGRLLTVADDTDIHSLAQSLRKAPPALLLSETDKGKVFDRTHAQAWGLLERRFAAQFHDAVFDFTWRMMVGVGWLAAATAGLRIHEAFETAGIVLGVLGLGFVGYTVMRYGYAIVRWHNRRVDATDAFGRATIYHHPLATRLAAALELRTKLKSADRGQSPDDELLDTNAYRKLIANGTTTSAEFTRLGEALNAALKFQDEQGHARKISGIADEAGIDPETAIFYRDLAAAASEIKLLDRVKTE